MEVTWIAIIASVFMGIGGVLIFIFAVKRNYFRDLEDAKYQMFWSDVEELVESGKPKEEEEHGGKDAGNNPRA
jgi:nitrogen fixation-related uncharacterized protein